MRTCSSNSHCCSSELLRVYSCGRVRLRGALLVAASQIFWNAGLVEASEQNKADAMAWIHEEVKERGTTNIMRPLEMALHVLLQVGLAGCGGWRQY